MKASKTFATENGTSHLPSNMKHTTATVVGVAVPMTDQQIVVLDLCQMRSTKHVLKVRMTADEALRLAAALTRAASTFGFIDVL